MKSMHQSFLATIALLTMAASTQANAASALLEKKDGTIVSIVIPANTCPISFETRTRDSAEQQYYVFAPTDGLVMINNHIFGGWTWRVISKEFGELKDVSLRWHFGDKEKTQPSTTTHPNLSADSKLGKAYLDAQIELNKPCTGYINSVAQMFGVSLANTEKVTFYSNDRAASDIVQNANNKMAEEAQKQEALANAWRKKLSRGADTHCGMIIEINAPLMKVQTMIGEKWFKTSQLYPPGMKNCRFSNGVYQD